MAAETFFNGAVISQQSVDFGALVAGVAEVDLTVEGADPGDAILVTKPDTAILTNSTQVTGYCDVADQVTVVAFDNDATATDNFAAVTLTIVVFT